jgi:hypothetical protein
MSPSGRRGPQTLRVRTDIPFGNACDVHISTDGHTPVISFAADPHGGPEALWFCFRIEDDATPSYCGPARLVIKNMQNVLGGGQPTVFRPVARVGDGPWERLGPGERVEHADGRWSGQWRVDISGLPLDIALCYPYGPEDVESLVRDSGGDWRSDTIGVSQGSRPIVRLSNDYGNDSCERSGLYLIARQHSGETPGSWVLDGLLRRMAEARDTAPLIWAVPLSNIDGIIQGDYGKDNFPHDLNRAWGTPPMRHEIHVIAGDMRRWRVRCEPMLGLDFHAPGGSEAEGVYSFLPRAINSAPLLRRSLDWADCLAGALTADYAAPEFARIATYASRWDTPTFSTYCADTFDIPGLSIETPYAMVGESLLTVEQYREIGRRIASAVLARLSGA